MANQDWESFGEEIRRTVQNAVDSQDFEKLNQTISNTINRAVDSAASGLRTMGDAIDKTARTGWTKDKDSKGDKRGYRSAEQGAGMQRGTESRSTGVEYRGAIPAYRPPYYASTASKKVGAIFLTICGYGIGAFFLLMLILFVLGSSLAAQFGVGFWVMSVICLILIGVFGTMAGIGTSMLGRIKRFQTYIRELRGKEYCDMKLLASKTGRSVKSVVKDVERMIEKGWFRQGHLDEQKTCLMVSDNAYDQYAQLMRQTQRQAREEEERKKQQAADQQKNSGLAPEVQAVIREGDEYISKIRTSNDAIPGEEISAKISRMEMLVDKIFDRVEQNPESVTEIRRLMEYYLPTTVKLLDAYEDLDRQPVQGENILNAKSEIEKTLDTLNVAFEKLLDSLFQDTAWDVAADASVLKTMLAQEGLTEDGLTGKTKDL